MTVELFEDMMCGSCRLEKNDNLVWFEETTRTVKCPVHGDVTPIVRCVCGHKHILNLKRTTDQLAVVCHRCGSRLMWSNGVPVAHNHNHETVTLRVFTVLKI